MKDFIKEIHLKFIFHLNDMIGKYGQNTFCRKGDVKSIVAELVYNWKDNPVARNRFQEALDDIEKLKV